MFGGGGSSSNVVESPDWMPDSIRKNWGGCQVGCWWRTELESQSTFWKQKKNKYKKPINNKTNIQNKPQNKANIKKQNKTNIQTQIKTNLDNSYASLASESFENFENKKWLPTSQIYSRYLNEFEHICTSLASFG